MTNVEFMIDNQDDAAEEEQQLARLFRVETVKHSGSLDGDDWQTELEVKEIK